MASDAHDEIGAFAFDLELGDHVDDERVLLAAGDVGVAEVAADDRAAGS